MNEPIQLEVVQYREALDHWLAECRRRLSLLFPKIDFDADYWPVRKLYKTEQSDWSFTAPIADFATKDRSFRDVLRCLVTEMLIKGKPKVLLTPIAAFRRLASTSAPSVFDLTVTDLRAVEAAGLVHSRTHPFASTSISRDLKILSAQLNLLANKNVLPHLGYHVRAGVRTELRTRWKSHTTTRQAKRRELLDHKMEALNEALSAMLDHDPQLNAIDRVAICAMIRKLCAPSRINEIVCSSINDYVTVVDYAQKSVNTKHAAHSAHQMLLVTMKGSKGAEWSAKPVLNFMIDAFHFTEEVIREHGTRSRMLIEWYQAHPSTLYLPPDLESLRGRALSRRDLASILYLKHTHRGGGELPVAQVFTALKARCFKAPNPDTLTSSGRVNARKTIDFLPWPDTEEYLLGRVHQAIADCRKVTQLNHYEGDLSKMLFLFDRDELPYLPYALNDGAIRRRLKRPDVDKKSIAPPTLFEKLRITMPVDGRIQIAEMDTHDPRRWLTTMALQHGENLSDVLINKWANRSSLAQLKAYDFRTADELAAFSKMPDISELKDLSGGLEQARKLEETYGLGANIVVVHEAGINVTSLDRILQAVEDRPVAKTSEQVIIVYPSRYGACLHQHHETPCRRYAICLTCDRNLCVKGHSLTNDEIRKDAALLTTTIVRQLDRLIPAFNRGIADHPDMFAEHLAMLVGRGLCPELMADELIAEFHEIKDQIKDKLLLTRLEEAFVARGYVRLLDDDSVANGALMKYHNPKQHAAPGLEMALDTHGGRGQLARDEQALIDRFPMFAPTALGLRDERQLVESDEDNDKEGE